MIANAKSVDVRDALEHERQQWWDSLEEEDRQAWLGAGIEQPGVTGE